MTVERFRWADLLGIRSGAEGAPVHTESLVAAPLVSQWRCAESASSQVLCQWPMRGSPTPPTSVRAPPL